MPLAPIYSSTIVLAEIRNNIDTLPTCLSIWHKDAIHLNLQAAGRWALIDSILDFMCMCWNLVRVLHVMGMTHIMGVLHIMSVVHIMRMVHVMGMIHIVGVVHVMLMTGQSDGVAVIP
ncbi:hypothetical protein B9T62_11140 [Paenibacillus donghaensis]|uniref:Uncharacterized protein n=1 Tax=Paenibacillus donghaensis TaxID=414771 RepID=A0A2Z2KMM6_9BACL|nr:hypothetical protein B9T62_11140 [Paenibacillus donghaensis]